MERYLIDTNIVSDYFSASLPAEGLAFLESIIDRIANISVITQIELLSWGLTATRRQAKRQRMRCLYNGFCGREGRRH